MKTLKGKRALVTGAAQGIGKEISLRFARDGAEIVVVDLRKEQFPQAIRDVEAAGGKASAYVGDVTDFASIPRLRDRIHADLGPIDVLVNNAGTVFGGRFLDVPWEKHLLTYQVNTLGLVAMTHAFLPDLIARPEAHLVNIASAAGHVALPFGATYASSKFSVVGFSESIRLELKKLGHGHVGVTSVCPSVVNTALFKGTKPAKTTQVLEPAYLAEKVAQAVHADKPFVMEPFLVRITPFLKGILPLKVQDWMFEFFGATSAMESWNGYTKASISSPGAEANSSPSAAPSDRKESAKERQPVA